MKERDIRPQAAFDEFLEISLREAERLFPDRGSFTDIRCPACDSPRSRQEFLKHAFVYKSCRDCGSLYVSPRPCRGALQGYYRDSKAVEHWAEVFYKETEAARRAQIVRPRAKLVGEWAEKTGARGAFVDVGAGYGVLLEEIRALGAFDPIVGVEPSAPLAQVCRERGFEVIEEEAEDVEEGRLRAAFATCFEVLEHVFDPHAFVCSVRRLLAPGGLLLFTTLTISGFDLQELWSRSKSIFPPNHLNLLSTAGIEKLVGRCRMDLLDLNTPGQLDVDILRNALEEDPELPVSRFARAIAGAPEATREAFQRLLRENRLSSHVRVVARCP